MNRIICLIISLVGYCGLWASPVVVEVSPQPGNDNQNMIASIEKASLYKGKPVVIKLHPGVYDFSRSESQEKLYYVSRIGESQSGKAYCFVAEGSGECND